MAISSCRDCGKSVRWATTVNGVRMKFDFLPSDDGQYVLDYRQAFYDRDGEIVPARWSATWVSAEFRERAVELHSAHDEKCVPIKIAGAA